MTRVQSQVIRLLAILVWEMELGVRFQLSQLNENGQKLWFWSRKPRLRNKNRVFLFTPKIEKFRVFSTSGGSSNLFWKIMYLLWLINSPQAYTSPNNIVSLVRNSMITDANIKFYHGEIWENFIAINFWKFLTSGLTYTHWIMFFLFYIHVPNVSTYKRSRRFSFSPSTAVSKEFWSFVAFHPTVSIHPILR